MGFAVNENDIQKTLIEAVPKMLNWIITFKDSQVRLCSFLIAVTCVLDYLFVLVWIWFIIAKAVPHPSWIDCEPHKFLHGAHSFICNSIFTGLHCGFFFFVHVFMS